MKMMTRNKPNLLNFQINYSNTRDPTYEIKETENTSTSDTLSIIQDLKIKRSEILNKINSPETEQDFRSYCSLHENQGSNSDPTVLQSYEEYIKSYHQISSIYLINKINSKTNLTIYDTESEREEIKVLETPSPVDWGVCITQISNGELFCYGNFPVTKDSFIIDRNCGVRVLPSGTSCSFSSAIYFNRKIYCFGGRDEYDNWLTLSEEFDFDRNRWIKLAPLLEADYCCHSIIFKGNIIISGFYCSNLWLYSIDVDSFSIIPAEFEGCRIKILASAERLYLIESFYGKIYENEAEDEYTWKQIADSIITSEPSQVYWVYNKGGIYITVSSEKKYYKFDLDKKVMIKFNKNKTI